MEVKSSIIREPDYNKTMQKKFKSKTQDRLDKVINSYLTDFSRNYIATLIKSKNVRVNNEILLKPAYIVKVGDSIVIDIPKSISQDLLPLDAPLDVIHEDDDLLVINKSPFVPVHPSHGHSNDTLVNILIHHYPEFKNFEPINGIHRPGIVHRLDKDTSGIITIAKNQKSMQKLSSDLKNRKWTKKYVALVLNNTQKTKGTISKNIIRHPKDRKKFITTTFDKGKSAITHYRVLENYEFEKNLFSLVEINIETGRTHQIRIHLSSENMPVLGDSMYNSRESKKLSKHLQIKRQLLHSFYLELPHPSKKEKVVFLSDYPEDFVKIIEKISK